MAVRKKKKKFRETNNYLNFINSSTRPLVTTIKRWAKFHDINDAAKQTISSYSLVLMAIFYLQNVCKPAVMPVLQELYPVSY